MIIDLLYLIAAICFILALKGLSSPDSASSGNWIGIAGMVFACVATYFSTDISDAMLTLVAICIGGGVGIYIAKSVSMTSLPQMVAGFHSLVGMAAVLVAFSAYYAPQIFKIIDKLGNIYKSSLIEMGFGVAIGAITFSGSLIAFAKLHEIYKGNDIPKELNAFLGSSVLCLIFFFVMTESPYAFLLIALCSFLFHSRSDSYNADWRRRHAGCCFHA